MMRLFDPDPQLKWLFCLTHPDDEISICAWIHRLTKQGNPVYMSWTHSNSVREAEARAVARKLGVPQENLIFHGATDGNVCMETVELVPKFREMIRLVEPDRVCCGAFEQGHLDHDSTNYILRQVADCPILEIPFYHPYTTRFQTLNRFSDPKGQEVLELDEEEGHLKRLVAKQYPSQNIWQVLFWYELSQIARFRKMELAKTERMRLQSDCNFLQPNHPPHLSRKVVRSENWRRWREALRIYTERV